MNDLPTETDRDELDRRIRAALKLDATPQPVARLETFWHRRRRTQKRRRYLAAASTLAALILVALMISLPARRPDSGRVQTAINSPRQGREFAPGAIAAQADTPFVSAYPPEKDLPRLTGRVPTGYEEFVFTARSSRTTGRPPAGAIVADLTERLHREPQADVERLVRDSGLSPAVIEQELLRRLTRSGSGSTSSVIRLLAVCGTWRSALRLLRLAEREELCDEALAAAERIAGTAALTGMARRSPDRRVRAAVYRRLLLAGEELSLNTYLTLIQDATTRAEALAVADGLSETQVTSLFARLDEEDERVRLAAALVLGEANGPAVTRQLIDRVTGPERRIGDREAWIALVRCRDGQAASFRAFASRHPRLLGSFNRARFWLLANGFSA